MATFTDTENRTWAVIVNVKTFKDLKEFLNFDLMLFDENTLSEIKYNPELLANILYICCKDQCIEKNISDEQFGRGLGGEALGNGIDAFLEGVVNFIQNPKARKALRMTLAMAKKGDDLMIDKIIEGIEAVNLEVHGTPSLNSLEDRLLPMQTLTQPES